MTGNAYIEGGGVEPIYIAYSEGRIKEEKFAIDLYLWFDESKGESEKGFHYFIANGPHYAALCACFEPILRSIGAPRVMSQRLPTLKLAREIP